jgi:TonB family protein
MAKQQGATVMTLCVDAEGGVTDARLKQSAGFCVLDEAALTHVRSAKVEPATNANGQTVEFCGWQLTIIWSIDDEEDAFAQEP